MGVELIGLAHGLNVGVKRGAWDSGGTEGRWEA